MERAIDPDLLALALGGQTGLPTPVDLARMLSETELQLLTGGKVIDDALVATGWYLHAIAASQWATAKYGPARQRAAFSVAAHVLDLALQCRGMSPDDRLRHCFAAQVAYVRSQLEPNAIALFRREIGDDTRQLALELEPERIALTCGVATLGMDIGRVTAIARPLIERSRRLATEWAVESVTNTIFGAAALVASGSHDLAFFLQHGDVRRLRSARGQFRRAITSDAALADRTSRWVAAHLLVITDVLGDASIWTALPPDVPPDVRRAFALGSPPILTLWPPQASFFPKPGDETHHPLDPTVRRLLLATPTSGGKTLLAQLLVAAHLSKRESSVCYVAPTRSLGHEVRSQLERRVRALRGSVTDDMPAWVPLVDPPTAVSVEVMTPERLAYLLRTDADTVLARFGLFIFDEVQNVGENGRGWTLEAILSYLHHVTGNTNHRLVLISAVAGNRAHFLEWLGGEQDPAVLECHSDWRAPRRLHALWTTNIDWRTPTQQPQTRKSTSRRTRFPIHGRLHVRASGKGNVAHLQFSDPVGEAVMRMLPSGKWKRIADTTTPSYKCLVPLIRHLATSGPTLVIESTRSSATRMATAIASGGTNPLPSAPRSLIDLVDGRLGSEHPLASTLQAGVAYHHGSLPAEVRAGIEEAVSEGQLSCLVATTTMTEGINLPVRAVVIAAQGTHGKDGYHEYITGSKLINAIGRAGRATRETEGVIVLVRPTRFSENDFKRLDSAGVDTTVGSMLASQTALDELAAFEELRAAGADAVFQASGHTVPAFLAYVWFVASRQEELSGAATLEELEAALARTFGWVQLKEAGRTRWRDAARLAFDRFQQTAPEARRKWARAGTSLSSAQVIDAIGHQVVEELEGQPIPTDVIPAIELLLANGRLAQLLELREAPVVHVYTNRGGARVEIAVSLASVLRDWLSGRELKTLANVHFADVADVGFRFEQLGDYLNDYFETYLPWTLSALIAWVNRALQDRGTLVGFPSDIPAYIRSGVNDATALHLMNNGIRSRSLARAVAAAWRREASAHEALTTNVRSWLGSRGVAAWQQLFNASVADLRNLLDYAKQPGAGLMASLLAGEGASLDMPMESDIADGTEARLQITERSNLAPIDVWVSDAKVATVPSSNQSDLHAVLAAGLPIAVRVINRDGRQGITLAPINETDQYELL